MRTCSRDDCDRKHEARGLCARHYHQAYNAKQLKPAEPPTALARFDSHMNVRPDGCHEWTGPKNNKGYGRFLVDGGKVMATRWIYEQTVGPIPPGEDLCHTCDNPSCVNVEHLWPGSVSDNMRDMVAKGRFRNQNTGKTHCKRGHELSEGNIYRHGSRRICKTCLRDRTRAYRTPHLA